ncbi:hypothetical protein C0991_012006 [Blastosporella zonata]|nr:hypothetical protein C0991_012006 [Blastosporella zonata]
MPGTPDVIALLPDHVDTGLTAFLGQIIDTYSKLGHCGYGCSDHISWYVLGYPVCFPLEGRLNETDAYRHSSYDTVDVSGFSWDHTMEYAKIIVGWIYELGA